MTSADRAVGIVQCKRLESGISLPAVFKEICKLILFAKVNGDLAFDTAMLYMMVLARDPAGTVVEFFARSQELESTYHDDIAAAVCAVRRDYATLAGLTAADAETEVRRVWPTLSLKLLRPTDLDEWLAREITISGHFFRQRMVADISMVTQGQQELIALIKANGTEKDAETIGLSPELVSYVRTYLESEVVQPAGDGEVNSQLATMVTPLSGLFAASCVGAVYDIGSGSGPLLERLGTLPAFTGNPTWRYVPIDDEDKNETVVVLANRLKLLSRTSPLTVIEFESETVSFEGTQIFFCRNVLHELSVYAVARLIRNVCTKFREGDALLIQDLLRFPVGERNHHCWTMEQLSSAIRQIGFVSVNVEPFRSQRGNAWFNLTARNLRGVPTEARMREILLGARREQWKLWAALDRDDNATPDREALLEALDIDLQLASLTRELTQLGSLEARLSPAVERRLRLAGIVRPIEDLASSATLSGSSIVAPSGFRERGAQLTTGENFLRSQGRLALVHGGRGTGKTTFIEHLLSTRLYDKALIRLDARVTPGVWPLVEAMLSQLGVRLSGDVLSAVGEMRYSHIAPAIGRLLNRFAAQMVFVVDNLEDLLDSNGRFIDPEVASFVCQFVRKGGIKVVVSSRGESLPAELHKAAGTNLVVAMRMGRFGTEQTVINLLDDYFDRARAGLAEYPRVLLDSIDRHPLVAALAGRILRHEGTGVLIDERFLLDLKGRLRSELLARLVDSRSHSSVEAASEIRIAVPATVLEQLTTRESVAAARVSDVLYSVPDRRWNELLAPLGLLRRRSGSDLMPASAVDIESAAPEFHGRISEILRRIYKADDDPKWMRESYYHQMLSGEVPRTSLARFAGSYYFVELVGSAHYCFEHSREYGAALQLYNAALQLGALDEQALVRRASCMIRTKSQKEGNQEYERLISSYPSNVGMRRSHIDALLFVDEYKCAKVRLVDYGLAPQNDSWNARQLGLVELGLYNYDQAIKVLAALRPRRPDDPYIVTCLARALQQNGDLKGAIIVLKEGAATFERNSSILTLLGSSYELARQDDEAFELLDRLFTQDASNARAALSLVRLHLRAKNDDAARSTLRRAEKNPPDSMRSSIVIAHAELLIYDRNAAGAIEYLRTNAAGDDRDSVLRMQIVALLAAAEQATNAAERVAFLDEAAAVTVPAHLVGNAPVQVVLARPAAIRGERGRFDEALKKPSQDTDRCD